MADLSIVIVSWNTSARTQACLASIERNAPGGRTLEVFVVDNASGDDTVARIRERFPGVRLIESSENLGFGRANNLAIPAASGGVVLFLNSDAEITEGFVESLLGAFDRNPKIAALGCRILGYDGKPQKSVRGFPSLRAYLYSDTPLRWVGLFRGAYRRYRQKDFDFGRWQKIDVAMGAALALRGSALEELGGFDPRYFMYFEEVDLCRRMSDMGLELAYCPDAVVLHVGGESSRQNRARMMLVYRQSMLLYFRKHHPGWRVALFELFFKPLFLVDVATTCGLNWVKAKWSLYFSPSVRRAEVSQRYRRRYELQKCFLRDYSLTWLRS